MLKVDVSKYLKDTVENVNEEGLKLAKNPARLDLFNIDNISSLVDEVKRSKFHSIVI